MPELPDRPQLLATIAALDPLLQKVVGGVVMAMIAAPTEVTDREFLAETLTKVAAKALLLPDPASEPQTEEQTLTLQAWVREHRDVVLDTAFAVFVRAAEDLAGSSVQDISPERAAAAALVYLAPPPE
ncbi:MAG: hypothetical protein ACYTFV_03640 [Planctomycetota bacterium]|jgi:hypothetical protein